MTPKEIAAQYEAKVFDTPEAAKVAGFVLTETMAAAKRLEQSQRGAGDRHQTCEETRERRSDRDWIGYRSRGA